MTKPILATLAVLLALSGCVTPTTAPVVDTAAAPAPNPSVGGAAMLATRNVIDNAAAAPTLSTLARAVKAAGMTATLSGAGPFTVFAPTDEAFGRLAPGTVDTMLTPENKASLVRILTYHVVAGALTSEALRQRIAAGGGTATLTTVEGEVLAAKLVGSAIALTDVSGNVSYVETADVRQSNGIVHVVNGVLVPTLG